MKNDSHHTYFVSANAIPVSFQLIAGESKHCLEVNLGLYVLLNETAKIIFEDYSSIYTPEYKKKHIQPIFNLGYRFQKPQGGIIFRTYAGLFGIGIGLGYAF